MFQKLHKAARDYCEQQSAVVVPLLSLKQPARVSKKLWLVVAAVFCLLIGLITLVVYIQYDTSEVPPVAVAAMVSPANPEPAGIVLPAEKLMPPVLDQAVVAEVEQKLPEKVIERPKTPMRKMEKAVIVVHDVASDLTTRWLIKARQLVEKNDLPAANRYYDKILARESDSAAALTDKAYILQKMNTLAAQQELQNLAHANPDNVLMQVALAQLLMQRNESQMALATWQRVVQLAPDNADYRLSLAILYDRLGQGSSALALYRQVTAPVPAAIQQRIVYLSSLSQGTTNTP